MLELVGRGAYGDVYLAELDSGGAFRRRVALKILNDNASRLRSARERIQAEARILGHLAHRHIVTALDFVRMDQRWAIVMDYVPGADLEHIVAALDLSQARFPTPAAFEIGSAVADALHAAYTSAGDGGEPLRIIHRDIKPSNVLVTTTNDKAVPKIIDFGIAKATTARLTEKTVFTEFRQMIGTPEYMSPEQAGESNEDVDTRTDVYSTGVLLYELLVGATPFDSRRLRSAAFGEMQRIIREEDPPKPSTRLSTLVERSSHAERAIRAPRSVGEHPTRELMHVASASAAGGAEVSSKFRPADLAGELDWIVMKALEKDRTRRYESASAMAADIQRFLTGHAVHAAPPDAWYRAKKFVRRNKAPVIAAALLTLALVAGLVGTSLGFLNAEAQRKVAVMESIRAGQEKERADENATQARAAETIASRQAYSANLMSASTAINGAQYSTARAFLDAAPQSLRGWEWRVLHAKLDSSTRTCTTSAIPKSSTLFQFAVHPDGRSFFTIDGLGDALAQRWDLATGRLLQSFPPPDVTKALRHFRAVLSSDGRRLTITPRYRAVGSTSFIIEAWDLTTGERSGHVEIACPTGSDVRTIASADGSRVFVYEAGRVWSTRLALEGTTNRTGVVTPDIVAEQPLGHVAYPLAINHADTLIAEAKQASPYDVVLRDTRSLAPMVVLATGNHVQNASFSADDRWLGVAIADDTARVWDLAASPPTSVALKHPYQANNICFSPDASLVATIAMDRAIRIWDRASGTLLSTYPSEALDPYPLMFMPDGKTVAGWESDGTIRFWDVTAESAAVLRGHKSIVSAAKFAAGNPAGIIVSSSWEGADGSTGILRLWDAESGDEVGTYHGQLGDIVYAMEVSDDGRLAALGISNQKAGFLVRSGASDEPHVRTEVINLTTGERISSSPSRREHRWIAFGSDDRSLIVADWQFDSGRFWQVRLLDARTGEVRRTKELDPKALWVLARSPDGRTIAALPTRRWDLGAPADRPDTMLFLDAQTLETVREIDGFPERQSAMAFSPDGTRLVTGGEDGILRLFEIPTGKLLAATSTKSMDILTLAFSPDGTRLASAGMDRNVNILEARTLDQVAAFAGHRGHIGCLDWDADGHRLVSCSGDFTVRVWEPSPVRDRVTAKAARTAALGVVEPMVSKWFNELDQPEKVIEGINADMTLTELQRKSALQVVLKRGLEKQPEAKK